MAYKPCKLHKRGYIMTIGEKLLRLRTREQKTREDVAKIIGVSPQAIYKYETGIITNIPLDRIAAFSRLYNVTPSYLMGWEDYPLPLSEKEKSLILSYRAHPEIQDAVNRLLCIEKQPEKKLSSTVSDINPAQKNTIGDNILCQQISKRDFKKR